MSDLALVTESGNPSVGGKPAPQPHLPSRKTLDLRLAANRQFNQIVARITAEVGGEISTVQRASDRGVAKARLSSQTLSTPTRCAASLLTTI